MINSTTEARTSGFKDYLKQRCRERGISLHRLALLCDLNQIYFYQSINKNKENPPPWVLRRAAPHLGVTYLDLLVAADYLEDGDVYEWLNRGNGARASNGHAQRHEARG